MFYKKFGESKKYIVFLHGWGASHKDFLWLKENFEDDYSLLFVDFAGFGETQHGENARNVSDYANDLKTLLDGFEIEQLIFVAHSFGGRVAIKFLFYYQKLYNKLGLCLVDSAGILPKRGLIYKWRVYKYKKLKKKSTKNPKLISKLKSYGSDDYRALEPVMKQTFINVVNEDLSCYAKFIACKTLIVWGDKDNDTKPYMARKLNRLIKGSELIFLKGAGHFSFIEKKEEFVIILDSFLKTL